MQWKRRGKEEWRADPYMVVAYERMRDHRWTGEFVYAAYLLQLGPQGIKGREAIGPAAKTVEAAQRQCEIHAARQKGVA
jgi:hypothetical protein